MKHLLVLISFTLLLSSADEVNPTPGNVPVSTIDLDHGQGFQIAANSAENMTITHSSDCDWVVWYQDNDECDLGPIDKPDDMEDVMTFSIVCSELAEEGSYNFTMYCVDIEGNVLNSTDVPYVVKYPWS
jgi:hypothetical protein